MSLGILPSNKPDICAEFQGVKIKISKEETCSTVQVIDHYSLQMCVHFKKKSLLYEIPLISPKENSKQVHKPGTCL